MLSCTTNNAPRKILPNGDAIVLTEVVTGLTMPTFLGNAGDGSGRLFIVEQPGRILVFRDGELLPGVMEPLVRVISVISPGSTRLGSSRS